MLHAAQTIPVHGLNEASCSTPFHKTLGLEIVSSNRGGLRFTLGISLFKTRTSLDTTDARYLAVIWQTISTGR
jgi:hypothetical protein